MSLQTPFPMTVDAFVVWAEGLVYCGAPVADDAMEIDNPVIVVEVLSPSTRGIDESTKLTGYYLLVDPDAGVVTHHHKQTDRSIVTREVTPSSPLVLDPPGLTLDVSQFFS